MRAEFRRRSHFGARSVVLSISAVVFCAMWSQNSIACCKLQSVTLTVVGKDGTQVMLRETEIGNLPNYTAYGGYKNLLGNIRGLGNYTGVRFLVLCDLVGGMETDDKLRITAADDYQIDFAYSEVVLGEFTTYDPSTGVQVAHYQPLVPIMAYYYNGLDIPDGPLRAAIVNPEGLATDSTYWVKCVIKMEILGPVGESAGGMPPTQIRRLR